MKVELANSLPMFTKIAMNAFEEIVILTKLVVAVIIL